MTQINKIVVIQKSPIHDQGGFAACEVPQGTTLIEYVGEKIDNRESDYRLSLNNQFIFFLEDDLNLDGSVDWNPARFLNHSCAPNCDAELIDGRIWIIANRDICAGEELTFNYGYDLDDYREHPCCCGAPNCPGYIVAPEFFEVLQRSAAL